MRVVRHLKAGERPFHSPVVALGNFDGLHLGHGAIVRRTLDRAADLGGQPVVFTFSPHPVAVLAPERAPSLITSLAQRLYRLREAGLDGVVVQRFTPEFAAHTPREFVQRFLLAGLGAAVVVVGYNVTFGRDRAGTPDVLRSLGGELGFDVEVVDPLVLGTRKVSSSQVRKAIAAGDVDIAGELLGRLHEVRGIVRVGDRRGATIGFPTANILPRGGMLPPDGVYAVRVLIDGEPTRGGVANLGTNPTFGGVGRRLETHVLDYNGDLYGRTIRVAFVQRLRGEVKFDGVDALVAQIRADAEAARRIVAATS
ncbi:MAG: bifunctional riboflavin kinase/FAD synthetase [Candidatus Binatia bacterium]|nr:bifunctional riboflavin kinase/FAD synthetase [Candidatus Binatia bacterium]